MCFSMEWLEQLLVWCVIVGAIVAILRLVVPWAVAQLGLPLVGQVLNIILYAIICIIAIWIIFTLISCLMSMGGGGIGLFPHHH
jgi:hypothetical protein